MGLTLFTGAGGQAAWSYLTSNFPSQALNYDHICYVGAQNYLLGNSASMPNITFEVRGFLSLAGTAITFTGGLAVGAVSGTLTSAALANGVWNITFSSKEVRSCNVTGTAVTWVGGLVLAASTSAFAGGVYDADPSAIVFDYLTDPNHGVGFPAASIAGLTGANSFQNYCLALGLTLSPYETTQRAAADFLKEIFQITNSDAVWSAGTLKVLPYCDVAVSGNGTSYTPNLTPQFIFTDDDFLDIPELTRKPTADTFNHVRVEYLDRSNAYNTAPAEATDLGNIAQTGERVMTTLSFHGITNSTTARLVAQLALQTSLYERNTIRFQVRADYSLLEPLDYIGVTEKTLGYTGQIFRITEMTDDDKDFIEIRAMEIPGTARTASIYNWSNVAGYNANFGQAPGSVQAPAFLEAYGVLVSATGGRQLWITVGGPSSSAAWGGANVYMSFDNTTYTPVGIVTGAGRYGTISTNMTAVAAVPDVTTTMGVTLNNTLAVLGTGTATDAQDNRMLIAVGTGATLEIMSYQTAALVSAGQYNVTTIYRGLYGTTSQIHSIGAQFMRLDGNVLSLDIDPGWLGRTLYFKFCSFNNVGRATEDISTVVAYSYVLNRSVVAYNAVSSATLVASGTCVVYSPTTAFKQTTGAAAWDSSVYSAQNYTNGCTAECYASQVTGDVMLGLTVNPLVSNNYTNLAYAYHMQSSGALSIREGGTLIGTFGTYTTSDLLAIVYDGKHIAYYKNAVLIRSVPIASQTFFMQVCFYSPAAAVYGLSFDSMTGAPTTFTLTPLTNNVACVGNKATGNGFGANVAWAQRCFQSKEGYSNGCVISFSTAVLGGAHMLGLSNVPAVGNYTSIMTAGWYAHGDATRSEVVVGGAVVTWVSAAPALTDVYTITYDNFTFRWWFNGTLTYQWYSPNAGVLYAWGDGYYYTSAFKNISFEPYGQATPNPFIATNGCVTHDSTAYKSGGAANTWDSAVYSLNSYTICHLLFKTSDITKDFMFGLCTLPTTSNSYTNLNYAMQPRSGGGANWVIYESGTLISTFAAPTVTDLAAITYDGATVTYYLNGTVLRTVAVAGLTLYASSSFYTIGASVNSLEFGPSTKIPAIDTAQISPGAVTSVTIAPGAVTPSKLSAPYQLITSNFSGAFQGTFVVPSGYTTAVIEIWGSGGAGSVKNIATACGGGGGGAYCKKTIAVIGGNRITYAQAAGVSGPNYAGTNLNGSNGNSSTVTGTVSGGVINMSAGGGTGGQFSGPGGTGGTASGGDVNTAGANGTSATPGLGGASGSGSSAPGGGGDADVGGGVGGPGIQGQFQITLT
jgi:hypothetical protein